EDAKAAYDRGEFISALGYYKELDEKIPNQALVKYNIGTCYMAVKNPYNALDYYKQARKLQPNEPRYVTACEQLEANLNRAQQQREEGEGEWNENEQNSPQAGMSNPNGKQGKAHKNKGGSSDNNNNNNNGFAQFAAPKNEHIDLLSQMGVVAKGGKNGVSVTT